MSARYAYRLSDILDAASESLRKGPVQRAAKWVAEDLRLYPAHSFGHACALYPTTIARALRQAPRGDDERHDAFVARLSKAALRVARRHGVKAVEA